MSEKRACRVLGTRSRQEGRRAKVGRHPSRQRFSGCISRRFAGVATTSTSRVPHRPRSRSSSCGTIAIPPSSIRDAGTVQPATRITGQRFYKAEFLTLGSSRLICEEEGWHISHVHRLSRAEQANHQESLSSPQDRRFI